MTSTAASPAINAAVAPSLTPTASSPAATQAVAGDFMLALAQLVGSNAAPTSPASSAFIDMAMASDSVDEEITPSEDAAEAALLGLATLPITPVSPAATAFSPTRSTLDASDDSAIEDLFAELKHAREPGSALSAMFTSNAPTLDELSAQSALSIDAPHATSETLHTFTPPNESTATRPTAHEAPHSRPVHTPVGSQQWADEIGARLTMMAEAGKQTASLRLTPEHLGPLEIRIAINDDQASVWFGAAHADTRAAIEHALPRLRELFEANGMSLADAGVHRESPRDRASEPASSNSSDAGSSDDQPLAPTTALSRSGLIDAYA